MKLAAITMLFVLPMSLTDGPPSHSSHPATAKDYRELGKMLKEVKDSMQEARALIDPDCRDLSPEKTVRCAADTFGVSEDQAVSVWQCESFFGVEPPHTDAYHGPFQYLYSTYQSQQESMPDVVEWHELSPAVHDVRSNIMTAVAWASRHGWGPWSCA